VGVFGLLKTLPILSYFTSENKTRVRDSSGNPFLGWVRAFSARAQPKKDCNG
jgi:hypothetical protein